MVLANAPKAPLVLLLVLAGCISRGEPRRATVPTQVAVGFVHQSQSEGWKANVPETFRDRQFAELKKRNLRTALVADAGSGAELTRARLQAMSGAGANPKLAGGAPILALIETATRYDSQIVGRYRWTVFAKITVADASDIERATTRTVDIPITLEYDHQRDEAALGQAADPIARELGVVLDSYLASYGQTSAPSSAAVSNDPAPAYDAIYFVLVDRFANGDADNDGPLANRGDAAAWHGGDLAGLKSKLGYVANLGATLVWLTPIAKSRAEKFEGHGAFHGYWTEDLERVDPRFGTFNDLDALGEEAEKRGLGLLLDLVLNHVGPDTALSKQRPEWFHKNGPITDWNDPAQLQTHEVHGLPDFDQSNPEVYDYLLRAAKVWAKRPGIAGFRLDAVRHIDPEFWRRFSVDISDGETLLLGEVFDGNPAALASGFGYGFDLLFDFPLHYAATEAICKGGSLRELGAAFAADRAYPDPARLVTFADNHDTARAASICTDEELDRLLFLLLSVRGIPSVTYGTEVGLRGNGEPENRADMRFGELNATGNAIRRRLALRRAHPALRSRRRAIRLMSDDSIVWLQQAEGETAVLGISRDKIAQTIELGHRPTIASGFERCGESCLRLPAGSVGLAWVSGYPRLEAASRTVTFAISGQPDGEVLMLGNNPELGVWNPARAARAKGGRVTLELPIAEAFSYKLAVRRGGRLEFENGDNRRLLVSEKKPSLVELHWRK